MRIRTIIGILGIIFSLVSIGFVTQPGDSTLKSVMAGYLAGCLAGGGLYMIDAIIDGRLTHWCHDREPGVIVFVGLVVALLLFFSVAVIIINLIGHIGLSVAVGLLIGQWIFGSYIVPGLANIWYLFNQ